MNQQINPLLRKRKKIEFHFYERSWLVQSMNGIKMYYNSKVAYAAQT